MNRVVSVSCIGALGVILAGCVALPSPSPEPSSSASAAPSAAEVEQPAPMHEGGFTVRDLVERHGGELPASVTYEQLRDLYIASVAGIPDSLPTGYRYPREVPGSQQGDGAMYESSLADAIALDVWRCSWLQVVSEAEPGGDASTTALSHLSVYGLLPQSYTVDIAAYDDYWEQRVQAHGGVVGAATSEVEASCEGMVERE